MQLKTQTDYAVRILLYLSHAGTSVASKELSRALDISETYLPKITQRLRQAGWVKSSSGVHGGFHLLVKPGELTLLDVIREMEDGVYISRCLEPDGYCNRHATWSCSVRRVYEQAQQQLEGHFSVTLAALLASQ